jgi:hypothetical protein
LRTQRRPRWRHLLLLLLLLLLWTVVEMLLRVMRVV